MDTKQLDGTLNNCGAIGKIVEKDGKYVFEGVALDKTGETIEKITCVSGIMAITYIGGKISSKIAYKITDKIRQRKLRKAKAEAFDEMCKILDKVSQDLENEKSKGKHSNDEESE